MESFCRPREMEWIHIVDLVDEVDTYCRTREMEWIHIVELERWSGYIL